MSITERLRKLEQTAQQESCVPEPVHIVVKYGDDDDFHPTEADRERVNAAIAAGHLPSVVVWYGGETPDTRETVLARLRDADG